MQAHDCYCQSIGSVSCVAYCCTVGFQPPSRSYPDCPDRSPPSCRRPCLSVTLEKVYLHRWTFYQVIGGEQSWPARMSMKRNGPCPAALRSSFDRPKVWPQIDYSGSECLLLIFASFLAVWWSFPSSASTLRPHPHLAWAEWIGRWLSCR